MEVVCPSWLRVVRPEGGSTCLEDRSLHRSCAIDERLALLLDQVREPIELSDLTSSKGAGLSDGFVADLVRRGLLVESGRASFDQLFGPFQPTFVCCPGGEAGGAAVSVIGVPCEIFSTTGAGPAEGPAAIRVASAFAGYRTDVRGVSEGFFDHDAGMRILEGVSLRDLGDLRMPKGEASEAFGARLSRAAFVCRDAGSFPLFLGGDHSLTFGAVRGLADRPLDVLHLDAHSDLMDADARLVPTSGSVVRALLGQDYVRRLVSVGLRGVLQVEQRPWREGHTILSARRFRDLGPTAVAELVDGPCYVSIDVDVLDPSIAPGTNLPVPGGLLPDDICALVKAVAARATIIGADIVEVSPRHDLQLRTARLAAELALKLLALSLDAPRAPQREASDVERARRDERNASSARR